MAGNPERGERDLADRLGAVVLEIRVTYPEQGPMYGARRIVSLDDPRFALRYALERMVSDILREAGVE